MNILSVHNSYQQPGGEDQVFNAESNMLESRGHRVIRLHVRNDSIRGGNLVSIAAGTVWSLSSHHAISAIISRERPAVVHFHNTFPLLSPSVYYAAQRSGVPVVLTLHNYRLLCPAATFFRNGSICEDCLHAAIPLPSIRHQCYRGSRAGSAVVAAMLALHRAARTWARKVDVFIALTSFAREKFISGGIPAEKIVIKPNFVRDIGVVRESGEFALFIGRLSDEKGLAVLLDAWRKLRRIIPLRIIGDGPIAAQVRQAAATIPGVRWCGALAHEEVITNLKNARVLVVPSMWYEGLPIVILEAYSAGVPVIASDLGSLRELVDEGITGFKFRAGDADHLAAVITEVFEHSPTLVSGMRRAARRAYDERYTEEANYIQLIRIYEHGIRNGTRPLCAPGESVRSNIGSRLDAGQDPLHSSSP